MLLWIFLNGCQSEKATDCPVSWAQPMPMTALVTWEGEGGAPDETLLKDLPLILTVLLYTATALLVIWAEKMAMLPNIIS